MTLAGTAQDAKIKHRSSACPHDCPSTCALDVEVINGNKIGRVHGAEDNSYTAGVICAKVARYSERIHHPDRLLYPMRRTGPKGSNQFERISWDEALEQVSQAFLQAEKEFGSTSVWPYYYAGTMGLVMRDGIHRLRHAKRYSGMHGTICTGISWPGYTAGTGLRAGVDPREMAKSDCIVIWGTNAVHTQVNVMTHATRARKEHGTKIVAIDIYENATVKQADMGLVLRPGTDGALACAVMHVLFRDGYADWDYLEKYTDCPREFEQHLRTRDPTWASAITGLSEAEIVAFAHLVGQNKRTYFRMGYGFARQRNGAVAMHAAMCVPTVTGAWQYEGGGALHTNSSIFHWDKTLIEGLDARDSSIRMLDQSQIGEILTGDKNALLTDVPVRAMLIQNTNPMSVCPNQELVKKGFAREDLFVCVHEQFMTETAKMADIVLPATMFMEHDDFYQGGGHQHILLGSKLIDAPGECRSNHEVICAIAKRVGAKHRGFDMSPREIIDETLQVSGWGTLERLEKEKWIDAQPDFRTSHFLDGFAHADKKFHFKVDWEQVPIGNAGKKGPFESLPKFPDHWRVIEEATAEFPFRLATSPARNFLNSSFNQTPTSITREGFPKVFMHPSDAKERGIKDGAWVRVSNQRGAVQIRAQIMNGLQRGVLVAESVWPNSAFPDGRGINTLTGADPVAPFGGAAFHDNRVNIELLTTNPIN